MRWLTKCVTCLALLWSAAGWAFDPPVSDPRHLLESKAFFKPDLYLPTANIPLQEAQPRLSREAQDVWADFFARYGNDFHVYLDPRSGTPTNIQGAIPLIPGTGVGNGLTLASVSQQLARPVGKVDEALVADLLVKFLNDNEATLGVDLTQMGEPRVTQVTDHLWQVHIPQQLGGIPVRHARLLATLSHGNLVLLGTEAWSNVRISTLPLVPEEMAMVLGNGFLGLLATPQELWKRPTLELVPYARAETQDGDAFIGPLGTGYGHRLVWSYGFRMQPDESSWEVLVDAHSSEVLSVQDTNHYAKKKVSGGVYPLTSTGVCSAPERCGTMQSGYPMPYADTGMASPNNYANGAGLYDFTGGTARTSLSGRYVRINDHCGSVNETSATGDIDMGGTNNQHDCTVPSGRSAGDTASARSAFYEVNKIAEQARGWLPYNSWLSSQLYTTVNINNTCNAYYVNNTINFYRSGGGCRNTGEVGAVFDHEWGHALDNYDSNGWMSNSSEGYADIAAIYRLQTSCVGYGFFSGASTGCGTTSDGTGPNRNEAQVGAAHCNTNCSGVRDADWAKHSDKKADTPQNFVCTKCDSGPGPCGKQVHCSAAPTRQAAWDLVTRDLTASPFSYDSQTAFMIGNKLFYQGSGNVGTWHACTCSSNTSDGCGASNGYLQWLAADDDNGNLNDGTPHMTAIYNAFNRHNIACATPAPKNSGCANGPSTAPVLAATPSNNKVNLSWNAVPDAVSYAVLRTEGHAGCDFGKAVIAQLSDTRYTDTEAANGRQYCYNVVSVGASGACFSEASACVCSTPAACALPALPSLTSPANAATNQSVTPTLDWSDVSGAIAYDVQVATDSGFSNVVASADGLTSSEWTVSLTLNGGTTYYWRVRAINACDTGDWSASRSFTTCPGPTVPTLSSPASAATNVSVTGLLDWNNVSGATTYDVEVATDSSFNNVVRSAEALTASQWNVSPAMSASTTYYWRARAANACGPGTWSTSRSFTTQCVSLSAPSLTTPSSGATGVEVAPILEWSDVTAADTYEVQVSTTSAFTTLHASASGLVTSRWTISPPLSAGTTYYWRVRALNKCSTSAWSSARSLKTCGAPAVPALTSPLNAATGQVLAINLDWGNVSGALTYDVQLSTSSSFSSISRSATGLSSSLWTVFPELSPNATYYWRARATNGCTSGDWSASRSFGTCAAPTGTPSMVSPAYGANNMATSPILSWNGVSGATSYDVYVATDSSFNNVVRSANAGSSWTVTPALNANTTYYWKVRARNACTAGSWTGYRYFVTRP